MVLHYLTDLFSDTPIVGALALMLHVCKAITVSTLTKMDTFVGRVVLEAPPTLFDSCLFVVPPICKGIGSTLGLGSFFLRNFSGDIVDDRRSDVVIGVGLPSAEASTPMTSWISKQHHMTNQESQRDDEGMSNKVRIGNGLVRRLTKHDSKSGELMEHDSLYLQSK